MWTADDGLIALERRDDQTWLLAIAHRRASAAKVGDQVEYGGVRYRITSIGRKYRHAGHGGVVRLYVAGAEDVPATGGATEAQVTALRNFGVGRIVANAATRERASEWIDEMLSAKRGPDSDADVARLVRRINQLGE